MEPSVGKMEWISIRTIFTDCLKAKLQPFNIFLHYLYFSQCNPRFWIDNIKIIVKYCYSAKKLCTFAPYLTKFNRKIA